MIAKDRKSQEEKAWKESRGLKEEDKRKRCAAFEDAAHTMLNYVEDSEDVKVGPSGMNSWICRKKQVFLSCRSLREAKSSSRSSGKKRRRWTSQTSVRSHRNGTVPEKQCHLTRKGLLQTKQTAVSSHKKGTAP